MPTFLENYKFHENLTPYELDMIIVKYKIIRM